MDKTATQAAPGLPKAYEFEQVEARWHDRWRTAEAFQAGMVPARDNFAIVIPPPNVTGVLHVGHALNNTLQDILIRYHRMRGDNTLWVPGTDHAGIATQNVVERQLKTEGKSRHDLGRDGFIERVWQWRRDKGGTIINQLKRLGCSCDFSRERFTMDEGLSRAVREVFVRLYHEGLIYRGDYIVNWCPRCHTALADDEVEHEPTAGRLYHIRYPFADGDGFLVVATTRPETMLGDTAVAVHPSDERYLSFAGRGFKLPLTDRVIPLIFDHHVQQDFGSGALKVTPAHDRDDYEIGRRHDLPILKVMDDHGVMNVEAGAYAGLERFECRRRVVADLQDQGLLERIEDYQHGVGQCYRCKTVVEPTTSRQWFVAVRPLAERATAAVREGRVRLHPDTWYNTFYSWMDNIRDWCISRQIWWGHRIPAWSCAACGRLTVATDDPTACAHCGSVDIVQEDDVLDTWFSSALWPFSTLGWPERTPELAHFYPTAVLVTSFDILFFWVARMLMMGLHFMDEVPFRDVYLHALVRDKHGKKMSKSTGNVIDPLVMIERYGTDAFRFTLTAFAAQGREIRLDEERIEGYRHFINKLWNAARFAHMHLDGFLPTDAVPLNQVADLPLHHRWILSRVARVTGEQRQALDRLSFNEAALSVYQFIWREFCDWYLEWIKRELYGDDAQARNLARTVLLAVLEHVLALMHPITPFVTEEIWSVLPGERGLLMLSAFPEVREDWLDSAAEAEMELVMDVIAAVRTIRGEADLAPNLEIQAGVLGASEAELALLARHEADIRTLCKAAGLELRAEGSVPAGCGSHRVRQLEVFVPLRGLIDVAAELAKLAREEGRVTAELQRCAGKLANEGFRRSAPSEVVAREEARHEELTARLGRIASARERLRKLE